MSALTDAEIRSARADLATMLPDTCTVLRKTRAKDGGGGFETTYPPVASGVACRVTPATLSRSGGLQAAGAGVHDETTHTLTFPHGQDVRPGDRVTTDTAVLEVLAVQTGGAWELARHCEAKEVPGEP